jgi:hypothetical protein
LRLLGRAGGILLLAAFFLTMTLIFLCALLFTALFAWFDTVPFIAIVACYVAGGIAWRHLARRNRGPTEPPDDEYGGDIGVRVPTPPYDPVLAGEAENRAERRAG